MISQQAQQIHDRSLVWDTHACFPLNPNSDLSELKRYSGSGVNFVSLNIGMDMDSFETIMQVLARFRSYITSHSESYILALTVKDILEAKEAGKLAIAFDLEGSEPLLGNLNMISFYYDLGVRQMLLAYNKDNRASGGCMESNIGLTDFGRDVIREMNRVGMVVDVSHMGYRATMEAFEVSTAPVIFSHSNPNGLREHARNISDEQIKACAKTGGVVGINGIGDFLGGTSSELIVENIEYVMNLVGSEHVGIGLDYVVDKQELIDYIKGHPDVFPPEKFNDYLSFAEPEQFPEFTELLHQKGYSEQVISGILGGNFLRVAENVWK
ncbi:MAG: dipeptidase [Anaerolineae bacterium]|nr:dipeptidase [Anaerolineae bacterium]MCI0609848.1 dipeptidase [Anaerolineae bacterium]